MLSCVPWDGGTFSLEAQIWNISALCAIARMVNALSSRYLLTRLLHFSMILSWALRESREIEGSPRFRVYYGAAPHIVLERLPIARITRCSTMFVFWLGVGCNIYPMGKWHLVAGKSNTGQKCLVCTRAHAEFSEESQGFFIRLLHSGLWISQDGFDSRVCPLGWFFRTAHAEKYTHGQ